VSLLRRWRYALWSRWLERYSRRQAKAQYALPVLSVLARFPGVGVTANHYRGQLHAAIGDQQQAVKYYQQALANGPARDPTLHHHLGIALLALGRYPEAEASLGQAIERKPSAWWSYNALGELMLLQGRWPEAEHLFRKTLALNNAEPWAYYHLYEAEHVRLGREAALDNWLDAILAAPQMPALHLNSGMVWVEQGDYTAEHIEKLTRIAQRYPRSPDVLFLMGCLLSKRGEGSAATRYLARYMAQSWEQQSSGKINVQPTAKPTAPEPVKDPEFLIIGTSKSGSSALYDYLVDHPLVCPAVVKEVNFWTTYFNFGFEWYRACFMPIPASAAHISGEGSIRSLWHQQTPQRVASFRPDMKLLLILREPVARAYSEYHMRKRLGEDLPPWETLVAQALDVLPHCPLETDDLPERYDMNNVLLNGAVLPFLKRWRKYFPAKQFLVLRSEDLARDVTGTVNLAYTFLGLPPHRLSATARVNVGSYPPLAHELERRLRLWYQPHQGALSEFLAREMA
jgi:tetratricopeptide (TPR) repeat protein